MQVTFATGSRWLNFHICSNQTTLRWHCSAVFQSIYRCHPWSMQVVYAILICTSSYVRRRFQMRGSNVMAFVLVAWLNPGFGGQEKHNVLLLVVSSWLEEDMNLNGFSAFESWQNLFLVAQNLWVASRKDTILLRFFRTFWFDLVAIIACYFWICWDPETLHFSN